MNAGPGVLRWICVHLLATLFIGPISASIGGIVYAAAVPYMAGSALAAGIIAQGSGAAVLLAFLGTIQWLLLGPIMNVGPKWIITSALTGALFGCGWPLIQVVMYQVGWSPTGAAISATSSTIGFGVAQYLYLRSRVLRPAWWLLAAMLGALEGGYAVWVFYQLDLGSDTAMWTVTWSILLSFYALTTGLATVRMSMPSSVVSSEK